MTGKKSEILIQDEPDTVQEISSDDYDDTMAGPLLSDTVQEDGCDDRPCPNPFCADAFHKGKTKTPGSLAGSSTNAGSSSQASNCSAKESTSDCSATEIADETRVLMVDVSHSQPTEPQVIFREKETGAPQELKENINHVAVEFGPSLLKEKNHVAVEFGLSLLKEKNSVARQMQLKTKDFDATLWTRGFGTKEGQGVELTKTAAGQIGIAYAQARKWMEQILEQGCNFING